MGIVSFLVHLENVLFLLTDWPPHIYLILLSFYFIFLDLYKENEMQIAINLE